MFFASEHSEGHKIIKMAKTTLFWSKRHYSWQIDPLESTYTIFRDLPYFGWNSITFGRLDWYDIISNNMVIESK